MVDFTVQTISYFDSYQKRNKEIGLDIHPICKMLRFLEDLASSQCVKFSIQDWKLYYDDSRDRDPFIKYAYQDNENDCGLYVIVNSEILFFSPSIKRKNLLLNDYLNPTRVKDNKYRSNIAALILMFREQDFPFLKCNSKGGAFDFNHAMKTATPEQISSFTSASKNYHAAEVILEKFKINYLIYNYEKIVRGSIFKVGKFDNENIHNKLMLLCEPREKYINNSWLHYAKEDSNVLKKKKSTSASEAYKTVYYGNCSEEFLTHREMYFPEIGIQEISSDSVESDPDNQLDYKKLQKVALALPYFPLFDYGFRVISKADVQSYCKLCFCPFSKQGSVWKSMNEINYVTECSCNEYLTPYELLQHFRNSGCEYHSIVERYIFDVYSGFLKGLVNSEENSNHWGLYKPDTPEYRDSLFSFFTYGFESNLFLT